MKDEQCSQGRADYSYSGETEWNLGRERRRFKRFAVPFAVRELAPQSHVMRGTSIGQGGLFCPDAIPRKHGTEVLLEIDFLSKKRKPIVAPARVVHVGKGPGGMGLGFEFLRPDAKVEGALQAMAA